MLSFSAEIKALKVDWDNPFWCRVTAPKRKRSNSGKEAEEAEESYDEYADAEDFPGSDSEVSDAAVPSGGEGDLHIHDEDVAAPSKESSKPVGSGSESVSEVPVVATPSKKKVLTKKKGSASTPRIVLKFGKGAGSRTKVMLMHIFL